MKYRKLGNTGLIVSEVALGTMQFGGKMNMGNLGQEDTTRMVKLALDRGINFIDTADSYGPFVSERLIAQALHPYPKGLIIATKAGLQRPGPNQWEPDGRPEYLRERCEGSLLRLKLDRIELFQLHRIDARVPLEDQIGILLTLQKEGKIRHIGLSEVSVDQILAAQRLTPIATVQNLYNLVERRSEDVLNYCTQEGIGFIPWFPLATGTLATTGSPLESAARQLGATPGQIALAWLLKKSPVMLPIPGTSSVDHLESNAQSALLHLDDHLMEKLGRLTT